MFYRKKKNLNMYLNNWKKKIVFFTKIQFYCMQYFEYSYFMEKIQMYEFY